MEATTYQGPPSIRLRVRIYGLSEGVVTKRLALVGGACRSSYERWQPLELPFAEHLRKRAYARTDDEDGFSHQFLCIASLDMTLRDVRELVRKQFCKLYPGEGLIRVLRLRDEFDCDLDDDFLVGQLYSSEAVLLAVCQCASHEESHDSGRTFFTPISHTEDVASVLDPSGKASISKPTGKDLAKKVPALNPNLNSSSNASSGVDSDVPAISPKPRASRKKAPAKMSAAVEQITQTAKPAKVTETVVQSPRKKSESAKMAPSAATIEFSEPQVIEQSTENIHSPRPIHISPVISLPKDVTEFAAIIQAESSSDESSDGEPLIPIVRSESMSQNANEVSKAALSSDDTEDEQESLAFTQPRTSLTELTQELKRSSVDPVAPQSIRTKALLEIQGDADGNKGNRKRRHHSKKSVP
ncbi:hypothetical protein PSACC_00791 [Paramicrosporidium saccamoebae]|uniref:Nucleolar protein Dnt1-like N-terminal domain-containing protein n=1 Tax=Paramicrosporidium saccamoebae TaxID=1246581 RepID=A0A2H9TNQ2_9FUNG|nr:hypothetical protein PSACC_00791 [Paramicrosporidium saccamoebae]